MNTANYSHNRNARADSSPESPQRRQAEKKIRMMEELQSDLLDPKTVRRLVYDLRVHQIELEIQNEELRELQQELEAAKSRFKDLYDFAPAGYITVSNQADRRSQPHRRYFAERGSGNAGGAAVFSVHSFRGSGYLLPASGGYLRDG